MHVPTTGTLPLGDLKPLQVDEWFRGQRERGFGDRTLELCPLGIPGEGESRSGRNAKSIPG
jgi:hypothetical protein